MFLNAETQNTCKGLDILKGRGKKKKGYADIERSLEKLQVGIPCAKIKNWNKYSLKYFPYAATTITVGKGGVPKGGDYVKSSGVSLPETGEDISLSAKRTGNGVNIPKPDRVICTDTVQLGAEGQNCIIHNSPCAQQSCRNQK